MSRKLAVGFTCIVVLSAATPTVHASTCWDYTRADNRLTRKINRARTSRGLQRVYLDRHISKVSRYHTNEMLKTRSLWHTANSVLGYRVTRWIGLGENVGVARSPRRLFRLMMNHTLHRANILTPAWNYVGLGALWKRGRLWVTMTFESRENPGTRMSMPRC